MDAPAGERPGIKRKRGTQRKRESPPAKRASRLGVSDKGGDGRLPVKTVSADRKQALTDLVGGGTVCDMTITIPDELDEFVRAKLQAGGFESPAEVVTAALTAWQGQEVYRAMDRDQVEHLLLEAIDSPRIPWEEANFDRIIESLRQKHGAA